MYLRQLKKLLWFTMLYLCSISAMHFEKYIFDIIIKSQGVAIHAMQWAPCLTDYD